ncbi:putative quinol monooxygenase [Spartinivicinus ruber]|uniref:putative quinol monooxygenase n=1 Tax=Spartinivicinus ruber TaxID=2683272 RepID=UPI0013D3838E|nr:putative quinol monooxygenase [Spartinivicinus ruber]
MNKLIIIAKIEAFPEHAAFVKQELLKLVEPSRQDPGSVQYQLHQDNSNPALFFFYEIWENEVLFQEHMKTAHLNNYIAVTEGRIKDFSMNELTVIS